jgi:hypothetical protein
MSLRTALSLGFVGNRTELRNLLRYSFAMPTYFFHVLDGDNFLEDEEGQDLADLEAVKGVAIMGAREQIGEAAQRGKDVIHRRFVVLDEAGETVFTLPYREAISRS